MTEDDLREQLRRADRAASLTPISPEMAKRLLENAMSTTNTNPPKAQTANRPHRPRRIAMLTAAAALAVLAVSAGILSFGNSRTPETATAPTLTKEQSVTQISAGNGASSGKCLPPDTEQLAALAHLAIEGTVVRIEGSTVTLKVNHVFTGAKTDLVQVTQVGEDTASLLAGAVLEQGKTYLIAASTQGSVLSCGYSGLAEPQLRELYDAAF